MVFGRNAVVAYFRSEFSCNFALLMGSYYRFVIKYVYVCVYVNEQMECSSRVAHTHTPTHAQFLPTYTIAKFSFEYVTQLFRVVARVAEAPFPNHPSPTGKGARREGRGATAYLH